LIFDNVDKSSEKIVSRGGIYAYEKQIFSGVASYGVKIFSVANW